MAGRSDESGEPMPVDQLVEAEARHEAELLDEAKHSPWKFVLRVAIGVAVVGVLVARTPNRDDLVDALTGARTAWVLVGGGAFLVGVVASAARWSAYLDALEIPMRFLVTLRLYFVGTFFNSFLPSGIGGDAYKAVRLGKLHGRYTPGVASLFLDRFAGFVALALIGLGGTSIHLASGGRDRVAVVGVLLSAGMLGAALLLLLGGERVLGGGRVVKHHGVGGKIRAAVRAIHDAARHREAAGRGYLFGLVFQLLALTYHLAVARALGITGISVGAMTGVVVIASLATVVPLSPGGLGFREAAYVWALGEFGIPHGTALAFALLVLAILLTSSAAGGLVYVARGGEIPRAEGQPVRST